MKVSEGFDMNQNYSRSSGKSKLGSKSVEMRGIEPRAFHMQSERSTTELHPQRFKVVF